MLTTDKNRVERRRFLTAAGSAGIAGLAGCIGGIGGGGSGGATAGEPGGGTTTLRIGHASPFSGGYGFYGTGQKRGVEAAFDVFNGSDELLPGVELVQVTGDTKTDPEVGLSAARDLIVQKGVDHLMGANSSAVANSIRNFMSDQEMIYAIMGATSGYLTSGEDCNRNTFRDHTHTGLSFQAYGQWGAENLGSDFYLLYQDYTFGYAYREQVIKGAESAGGNLVGEAAKPLGANEYGGVINEIMELDPEWLFMGMVGTGGVPFYTQAAQRGFDVPCFGMPSAPAMGKLTPDQLDRLPEVTHASWWFPELDAPGNEEFIGAFRDRYGEDPTDPAHFGYATAQMLALMIHEAGGADADLDEIIAAGEGLSFESPRGEITIRACDHQGAHPVYIHRLTGVEGEGPAQLELRERVETESLREPCEALDCRMDS